MNSRFFFAGFSPRAPSLRWLVYYRLNPEDLSAETVDRGDISYKDRWYNSRYVQSVCQSWLVDDVWVHTGCNLSTTCYHRKGFADLL